MEFCCFTPVPWPHLAERPASWPFPNSAFDSERGAACFDAAVEQLVFAEECGFDWVGVGEDHMTAYGLAPNPIMLLSVVAAQTKRIKLATMGCPLPLLNPVRVAEELAMLDVLSRGRVIAGLIRGVPQNYAAYGMDPAESRERFDEALELVQKCWTHPETFAWESTHYSFPSVSMWPTPYSAPHPPLLISANSTTSAELGARLRSRIGAIHLYNRNAIDRVAEAYDAYRRVAADAGWVPGSEMFLIGLPTCVAETDARAKELLAQALDYQFGVLSGTYNEQKRRIAQSTPGYGLSPTEEDPPGIDERLEQGLVLCGSPDTVAEQIRFLQERLGCGVISMHLQVGNMPHRAVMDGMRLFCDEIRPRFVRAEALG